MLNEEKYVCSICGTEWDGIQAEHNTFICCSSIEKITPKVFTIPVLWQVWGTMEIQAYTLEEAEEMALGDFPLPDVHSGENYIDGSIELDKDRPDYGEYCEVDTY